MSRWKMAAWSAAALMFLCAAAAPAKTVTIEFLQGPITPKTIGDLAGLACRNYDHIVHLDISVNWPAKNSDVETSDFQRLIFWDSKAEYLFPKDTYQYLHGDYVIKGYFIARNGGFHQGITSRAFEKVDDATVMLSPTVTEKKAGGKGCK
ncbi:MAG TPA: hypothetical protein VN823_17015 [Stellaceae bacterium]|nr:hypothetical protein [Stellaceae bacterium]